VICTATEESKGGEEFGFVDPQFFEQSNVASYLPAYEDGTDRVFRNVGI
jgi:hypothetical protein